MRVPVPPGPTPTRVQVSPSSTERSIAVDVVDAVRQALVGFRPPDCRKVWAVSEKFLGETAGLWQYAVDLATEAMLVEDADVNTETPLTLVTYEENP